MKIRLSISYLLAFIFLCLPVVSWAASVTLRWQANTEADIAGYNLYYGTASRDYGLPIPTGNVTSYTVDNLDEGQTYYFSLTALDTSGNESGYSSEISANATSSEPATEDYILLLSYNSDRSNAVKLSGQTISGDVYIYLNPEDYVSQVVFSIDGQTHNTENYAPYDVGEPFDTTSLSNGSHTISALIRLQDGSNQTIRSVCTVDNGTSTSTPVVSEPARSVTLTVAEASPQPVGTAVHFTASATGAGNYEYRFYKQTPAGSGNWVVVQDYSTASTFAWDTSAESASTSNVVVHVRQVGSTAAYETYTRLTYQLTAAQTTSPSVPVVSEPARSVTLTVAEASPQPVGTAVHFTASATGAGNYEYRFYKQTPAGSGNWVVVQDYSTASTFAWDTSAESASTSNVVVHVRQVGSTAAYETYTRLTYQLTAAQTTSPSVPVVSEPARSVTLTVAEASPQPVGTAIHFTASATGTGNYEYRFYKETPARSGNWSIVQDYSTASTFAWDTSAESASTSNVVVHVRQVGSTAAYETYTRLTYQLTAAQTTSPSVPVVSEPARSVTLTVAEASPQPVGTAVHFTASATGAGNYEYRFYKETPARSGNWSIVQDYSTASTFTWNTSAESASTSNVVVHVRQVGSTAAYETYTYIRYQLK